MARTGKSRRDPNELVASQTDDGTDLALPEQRAAVTNRPWCGRWTQGSKGFYREFRDGFIPSTSLRLVNTERYLFGGSTANGESAVKSRRTARTRGIVSGWPAGTASTMIMLFLPSIRLSSCPGASVRLAKGFKKPTVPRRVGDGDGRGPGRERRAAGQRS